MKHIIIKLINPRHVWEIAVLFGLDKKNHVPIEKVQNPIWFGATNHVRRTQRSANGKIAFQFFCTRLPSCYTFTERDFYGRILNSVPQFLSRDDDDTVVVVSVLVCWLRVHEATHKTTKMMLSVVVLRNFFSL